MDSNFKINNKTKETLPVFDFESVKNEILGKEYILTLHIVPSEEIKDLNKRYRNIDEATDILSFPLNKKEGEIFINLEESKKEAPKFGRELDNFIVFLFIHGLVHLKGFDHGSKMESEEQKYRGMFNI